MCYERTDMAIEAAAVFNKSADEIKKLKGVEINEETIDDIRLTQVKVIDEQGERLIGKAPGRYVTLDVPALLNTDEGLKNSIITVLGNQIKNLLMDNENMSVFVVGLGNEKITPDALGPKVVQHLNVTRHLFEELPQLTDDNTASVCAISPGVLGITGIETLEVIKGISDKIKPTVIICIDALATRSIERLSASVQLSDTGITPGSGVGNRRHTINIDTVGVPVIAIGVPTVVDGATIASDSIRLISSALEEFSSKEQAGFIEKLDDEKRYSLVRELLKPYQATLIVTPKDVDMMIEEMALIISSAINYALGNDKERNSI